MKTNSMGDILKKILDTVNFIEYVYQDNGPDYRYCISCDAKQDMHDKRCFEHKPDCAYELANKAIYGE